MNCSAATREILSRNIPGGDLAKRTICESAPVLSPEKQLCLVLLVRVLSPVKSAARQTESVTEKDKTNWCFIHLAHSTDYLLILWLSFSPLHLLFLHTVIFLILQNVNKHVWICCPLLRALHVAAHREAARKETYFLNDLPWYHSWGKFSVVNVWPTLVSLYILTHCVFTV